MPCALSPPVRHSSSCARPSAPSHVDRSGANFTSTHLDCPLMASLPHVGLEAWRAFLFILGLQLHCKVRVALILRTPFTRLVPPGLPPFPPRHLEICRYSSMSNSGPSSSPLPHFGLNASRSRSSSSVGSSASSRSGSSSSSSPQQDGRCAGSGLLRVCPSNASPVSSAAWSSACFL